MNDLAYGLADAAEIALGSDLAVDRITVTAGEPAAPASQCSALWFWVSRIENLTLNPREGIRTAVTVSFRLDVCYTENPDGSDQTTAQHEADSDALVDRAEALWCYFTQQSGGKALVVSGCEVAEVLPFDVELREGMITSFGGSVRFDYNCGNYTSS